MRLSNGHPVALGSLRCVEWFDPILGVLAVGVAKDWGNQTLTNVWRSDPTTSDNDDDSRNSQVIA